MAGDAGEANTAARATWLRGHDEVDFTKDSGHRIAQSINIPCRPYNYEFVFDESQVHQNILS